MLFAVIKNTACVKMDVQNPGKKVPLLLTRLLGRLSMERGYHSPHLYSKRWNTKLGTREILPNSCIMQEIRACSVWLAKWKNLHIDRIASYIPTVNIKEKRSI